VRKYSDGRRPGWHKVVIGAAATLALVVALIATPLGGLATSGLDFVWSSFLDLPGIAWARVQMEASGSETVDATQSQASTGVVEILEAGRSLQDNEAFEAALERYREALDLDQEFAPTR